MDTFKLVVSFHSGPYYRPGHPRVEIPVNLMEHENAADFWPEIQRQLAQHFLECAEQGKISPVISGFGPAAESRRLFEEQWSRIVEENKARELAEKDKE